MIGFRTDWRRKKLCFAAAMALCGSANAQVPVVGGNPRFADVLQHHLEQCLSFSDKSRKAWCVDYLRIKGAGDNGNRVSDGDLRESSEQKDVRAMQSSSTNDVPGERKITERTTQ